MKGKMTLKKYKNLFFVVLFMLLLTACGSGDPLDISVPKETIVISDNKMEDQKTLSEDQQGESGDENKEEIKTDDQVSGNDANGTSENQVSENNSDLKKQLENMETMDASMFAMRSVNVRSGPGKEYEKIGALAAGENVTVTGLVDTGWYQIVFGKNTGYVASSFLLKESPVSQPSGDAGAGDSGDGNTGTGNTQTVPTEQGTAPVADTTQSIQSTTQTTTTTSGLSGTHQPSFAQRVIELVNVERVNNGLAVFGSKTELMNGASKRAEESSILFEHARPDGRVWNSIADDYGIAYQYLGENLAARQTTPEQVVQSWMASAGHRANILDPNFANIGVGCFLASDGYYYWAQLFTN